MSLAAVKEISMDAAAVTVLSEMWGIFISKEERWTAVKALFLSEKSIRATSDWRFLTLVLHYADTFQRVHLISFLLYRPNQLAIMTSNPCWKSLRKSSPARCKKNAGSNICVRPLPVRAWACLRFSFRKCIQSSPVRHHKFHPVGPLGWTNLEQPTKDRMGTHSPRAQTSDLGPK